MTLATRMRSSSFRFEIACWINFVSFVTFPFTNNIGGDGLEFSGTFLFLQAVVVGLLSDMLDLIEWESSETVAGFKAAVWICVAGTYNVVSCWFIASSDSFVRDEIRRFLTGQPVLDRRSLLTVGRDRWQTISRHNSGLSRRNSGLWNAPVSGPRVIWRKPLRDVRTNVIC